MRNRTPKRIKGEIPTKVPPSKKSQASDECTAQAQPAHFLLAPRIAREAAETCMCIAACNAAVALRGESALAGWLKGPEGKGKVKERSLHAC